MIWLTWRRYRILLAVAIVLMGLLALYMAFVIHWIDAFRYSPACAHGGVNCVGAGARQRISLPTQVSIINFVLLALPCVLGVVFGAPLVASELEHHTNRLVWTQGISRTRWLVVKWGAIVVVLAVLTALLTVESQWWTQHAIENYSVNLDPGSVGRLGPDFFPISGVASTAYTIFAVALGTAAGALIRRTGWAMAATFLAYGAVAAFMVLAVRPNLAPQTFVEFPSIGSANQVIVSVDSWNLGTGYRFAPGSPGAASGASATLTATGCQDRNYNWAPFVACLHRHRLEQGTFYQPATNYWTLQWREAGILAGLALVLFGVTLWRVRTWRA